MLKFTGNELTTLYSAISGLRKLYLPIEKGGEVSYGPYTGTETVRLDVLKTVKSAKDAFFPQSEFLMKFKAEGKNITLETPSEEMEDFVVMGVRACDARSFDILDSVYLAKPVDSYYKTRRDHGLVITHACNEPAATCFCTVFGIDPAKPAGDISTWTADGTLYWEANTEKGKAFTEELEKALAEKAAEEAKLAEATEEDIAKVEAEQAAVTEMVKQLPFANLDLTGFDAEHMMEKFNDPQWKELSRACLGCGTCTYVCPTCQCYDIRDYDTGHGVQRIRCWDSCMYSDFTLMAGGNSRKTQVERFRQRFMHKLIYHPSNHEGTYSCVGCGRCLDKCPIQMNIVKVIKALGVKES
ncbi:MAG: 4Fe-4S dicluster domain-containing protein [Lachnospiraceae bacterium]|nr:4Fe-4S dicluster domain-containing protein [Lachnospiraceae bacterium]